MKIAINARFLLPGGQLEGLGWYTHEVLRRLVAMRPGDEFYFLFDRPHDPRYIYDENVRPVVLFPPARHPALWWIFFEISTKKWLARNRPDVYFSPDQYLSLGAKTPTLLTCHDLLALEFQGQVYGSAQWFYERFFPKYLRRADAVIAISEATKADILKYSGIENSKIKVVPNGCRGGFEPLQPADIQQVRDEISDGQPYFFYAGAIQPRKNIARLVAAFDLFKKEKNSPHKLLLGGRKAWQADDVDRAIEAAEHRADIQFLGYLDEKKLPKIMASATAFVFPSLAEGFGLPILEAMWAEVPVITSDRSAMPEVAGDAAFLVDPFSVEKIADAMSQLVDNQSLAADFIEKGRTRRLLFDWDKHAAAVSEMIEQLANKSVF